MSVRVGTSFGVTLVTVGAPKHRRNTWSGCWDRRLTSASGVDLHLGRRVRAGACVAPTVGVGQGADPGQLSPRLTDGHPDDAALEVGGPHPSWRVEVARRPLVPLLHLAGQPRHADAYGRWGRGRGRRTARAARSPDAGPRGRGRGAPDGEPQRPWTGAAVDGAA